MRIKDITNTLWSLMLPRIKIGGILSIRTDDIVRVRSVVRDQTTQRNVILAKASTNILKFMAGAKVIETMSKRI